MKNFKDLITLDYLKFFSVFPELNTLNIEWSASKRDKSLKGKIKYTIYPKEWYRLARVLEEVKFPLPSNVDLHVLECKLSKCINSYTNTEFKHLVNSLRNLNEIKYECIYISHIDGNLQSFEAQTVDVIGGNLEKAILELELKIAKEFRSN